MKRIIIRAAARQDIDLAADFYLLEASIDTTLKFATAVEDALRHIENFPSSGSPLYGEYLQTPLLRSWIIDRFPYILFYFDRAEHLEVVRLLHQHTDISAQLQDYINN